MLKRRDEDLSKDELDILYIFIKRKSMFNSNRISLHYFSSNFNDKVYDIPQLMEMFDNLVNVGYLMKEILIVGKKVRLNDEVNTFDIEYGIKDSLTYQNLCKKFRCRLICDKIWNLIKKIMAYLAKDLTTIIISVITALITTYISLHLFGK